MIEPLTPHRKDERYEHATMHYQGMGGDEGHQCNSVEEMRSEAIALSRTALEKRGDLPPIMFVYMPLETPNVALLVIDNMENKAQKRLMGRNISAFAARHHAAAVVMCTDGWAVKSPEDLAKACHEGKPGAEEALQRWTDEQYARYKSLDNHPDRFEVLSINTIYPDGSCIRYACKYERIKVSCDKCNGKGCDECHGRGTHQAIKWDEAHDELVDIKDGEGDGIKRTQQFIVPPWGISETLSASQTTKGELK